LGPTSILPTDQHSRFDQFGDGYIAKIKVEDLKGAAPEEIVAKLVTQWLEHYKTQSSDPMAAIKDFSIDGVRLADNPSKLDIPPNRNYVIVAGVRFSIIPKQEHNDYSSFPGEIFNPNSPWWHLSAPFGVIQVGDTYYLRMVWGWGT
jgi:hypothetical protein